MIRQRTELSTPNAAENTAFARRGWRLSDLTALLDNSRATTVAVTLASLFAVGAADYLTGFERSLHVFYLIPVGVAAWFAGARFAVLASILSVATWIIGDTAAGARYSSVAIPVWNGAIAFSSFLVVVWLLTRLRSILGQLERRVQERTADLEQEVARRVGLEEEIAEVTERERQRLGHELHDRICQHLTGTSLAAQVLSGELSEASLPQARSADKVVALVESAIDLTRNLARGLISLQLEGEGLCAALRELAQETIERHPVTCLCRCDDEIVVRDSLVATHLFRIAQEAVANACRHSYADEIIIGFDRIDGWTTLSVQDNGIGAQQVPPASTGLGRRIMAHRASLIGAELSTGQRSGRGTFVTCRLMDTDKAFAANPSHL